MSFSVLRTTDSWWVQVSGGARRIDTDATTTAGLLAARDAIEAAAGSDGPLTDPAMLSLISPSPRRAG